MAKRPVFCPTTDKVGVHELDVDFKWYSGFAIVQKQKSIQELHSAASKHGVNNILEVSSKSLDEIGKSLSAFNLTFTTKKYNNTFTVETAFQGSKVFENGGPYIDLFGLDSRAAKKDERLRSSGVLKSFQFFSFQFPLTPKTFFYDWLYINALTQSKYTNQILQYDGFTDIEFNPERSINCQAHSIALFTSLYMNNALSDALSSPEMFLKVLSEYYQNK